MDFFEQQDRARKGTWRLIVLFVLAMVGITALVYALVLAVLYLGRGYAEAQMTGGSAFGAILWTETLVYTAAGTSLTIGLCSIYKVAHLRSGGGASVAMSLGGMPIDPGTRDPDERKVLNVVEEMSIASGLPVPPVYMLGNETGINAFAAGYRPEAAVIGVTRGCVEQLSRDELQGVIAHEYSHILNGDMRLNIRLIGLVFGILALTVMGRLIVRGAFHGARVRTSSRDNGGGRLALLAIGVALIVIGYVGVLFGKLIQAAVSRQREFLADASAVQFTRNPDGIGGALKRIGGLVYGGQVDSPHAEETAHLFFANALSSFGGAFATHPPLPERIKRIDPRWDGKFIEPDAPAPPPRSAMSQAAVGFVGGAAPMFENQSTATESHAVVDSIGQLDDAHLEHAQQILRSLPTEVVEAAHHPVDSRALVYALLLDRSEGVQRKQVDTLMKEAPLVTARRAAALASVVLAMPRELRLPAVDLAVPALAAMAQPEYRKFAKVTEALIAVDDRVDLFEWALRRVIAQHVGARFERQLPERIRHHRLAAVRGQVEVVLSALVLVGHGEDEAAGQQAFQQAAKQLEGAGELRKRTRSEANMRAVASALEELSALAPKLKRQVVRACVAAVAADGRVSGNEAELLRVVVEAMGVPMPPVLPGPVGRSGKA